MMCTRNQAVSVGLLLSLLALPSSFAFAQGLDDPQGAVEVTDSPGTSPTPRVGRRAAEKYMAPRASGAASDSATLTERSSVAPEDHFLAVHLGGFIDDKSYKWGRDYVQEDRGKLNLGVTYRMGEWVNSMDLGFRAEYTTYNMDDGTASKLTFMPVITFPDAAARFPLYFGAGVGLGVFTDQLDGESVLSLDYTLFLGTRFFDIFRNAGFFIEFGLKNHLLLASDGQFNGMFVAMGPAFTF